MPLSACFIWEYRRILNLFSPLRGDRTASTEGQNERWAVTMSEQRVLIPQLHITHFATGPERDRSEREYGSGAAFKLCNIYFCQSILDDKFTASLQVSVWALLRESISRNTVKVQVNEITLRKQFLELHESQWRLLSSNVQSRINGERFKVAH